jgi:ribose transport system permease protein
MAQENKGRGLALLGSLPRGVTTTFLALLAVIVAGAFLAPSSISSGAILGMLPFAAILAIVGLGQMLVVQQGGIDLSLPGAMSLAIVIISHYPTGDDALVLPALGIAVLWALGAGLVNAFLVGWIGLNPIIATLGTNALLFGAILGISGGTPASNSPNSSYGRGRPYMGDPQHRIFCSNCSHHRQRCSQKDCRRAPV